MRALFRPVQTSIGQADLNRQRSAPQHQVAKPHVAACDHPTIVDRKLGEALRKDFPILQQTVHGKPLIYLDNAATSQKPQTVIDSIVDYYSRYNSNVHRGVHELSVLATAGYEEARQKVARFVNAKDDREIVFTKNASEALNLVGFSWGLNHLKPGDEIVTSVAEHHSNLEIWQRIAKWTGATVKYVGLTDTQEIDLQELQSAINSKTKLVTLVHVSNTLGAVLPVHDVVDMAHKVGAKVLLDCCQSLPHMPVDVQTLGADWIVGSAHKMCGPTGIGFLWGSFGLLSSMPPFLGGGEMIADVQLTGTTYADPPFRFEAGTPPICEAIAFGAACDYLSGIGMERVHAFEEEIGGYLYEKLSSVNGVTIYGPPPSRGRAALAAFNVEGVHANDLSSFLDAAGIAIRSGSHCTQPLHQVLGTFGSARASLYIYNTEAEVDAFVSELKDTIQFFQ